MNRLRQIYNPVSDTFLVLEDTGGRGKRYHCYREPRAIDGMPEGSAKKFRPFATRSLPEAVDVFKERAFHESDLWPEELVGDFYIRRGKRGFGGHVQKLCDQFMKAAYIKHLGLRDYVYGVCDPGAQKLYAFENEYFGYGKPVLISKETADKLAAKIAVRYGFEKPVLRYSEEEIYYRPAGRNVRGLASTGTTPYEVKLKTYGGRVEKRIFLHEMGHLVAHHSFGLVISHGPHFALAATHLYDRHMQLDQRRYFGLANEAKYRVFGPERVQAEDVLNADFTLEEADLWKDILRNTPMGQPSPSYSPAALFQVLESLDLRKP